MAGHPSTSGRQGDEPDGRSMMEREYRLVCRACPFERHVTGHDPALDRAERHERAAGDGHSVGVYLSSHDPTIAEVHEASSYGRPVVGEGDDAVDD